MYECGQGKITKFGLREKCARFTWAKVIGIRADQDLICQDQQLNIEIGEYMMNDPRLITVKVFKILLTYLLFYKI